MCTGVPMDKKHVSSLPVVSPSDRDLSDHREELIQTQATAKNEDDYIRFEEEDRDPTGSLIPSQRAYLNVQRKHIAELDRQLQEVETFIAQKRQTVLGIRSLFNRRYEIEEAPK